MAVLTREGRIDLAKEGSFALGPLTVVPAYRQVILGGRSETVEPRVMQVLVALVQADGGIVGRQSLIERCWDGRIVGDNAINRVISLLRKLSVGIGAGAFSIETIAKVGYRMRAGDISASAHAAADLPQAGAGEPDRRRAILGIAAAGIGAAAYLGWRSAPSSGRARAHALYQRGLAVQRDGDRDEAAQSIAYFARAARIDPGFAQAWGALALSRALVAPAGDAATPAVLDGVRQPAARALRIDPRNKDAALALIVVAPYWRNWAALERQVRAALAGMPDEVKLHAKLGSILSHVGRFRAGADELSLAVAREPLVPAYQVFLWRALWGAGRPADAQALMDRALARWPDNGMIWLSRFTQLSFTGKVAEATAMSGHGSAGRTDANPLPIDIGLLCARAFASGAAAARREAVHAVSLAAGRGTLARFLAIPYLSALGAVDQAFAVAWDLYFGRRDPVSGERELASPHDPRMTFLLFQPPTAAMRADPRFLKLTAAIGLEDYWRETRTQPDYRVG